MMSTISSHWQPLLTTETQSVSQAAEDSSTTHSVQVWESLEAKSLPNDLLTTPPCYPRSPVPSTKIQRVFHVISASPWWNSQFWDGGCSPPTGRDWGWPKSLTGRSRILITCAPAQGATSQPNELLRPWDAASSCCSTSTLVIAPWWFLVMRNWQIVDGFFLSDFQCFPLLSWWLFSC